MPKTLKSYRLDDSTLEKLAYLKTRYDSYSKAIAVAIDRLYQAEKANEQKE